MSSAANKAKPMGKEDVLLLISCVEAQKSITSKATNAASNKKKDEAWAAVTDLFNAGNSSHIPRTATQLKLKWENLKKTARKRSASMRNELNKTGGGPMTNFPPDEVLDRVKSLLGSTCLGFSVDLGGDAESLSSTRPETEATILEDSGEFHEVVMADGSVLTESVPVFAEESSALITLGSSAQIIPPPNSALKFSDRRAPKRKNNFSPEVTSRIERNKAVADYYKAKALKIQQESEEKKLIIENLKQVLENKKLENKLLKKQFQGD